MWKYCRAGILSRAGGERGFRAIVELVDEFAPLEPLAVEAFGLVMLLQRPVYDMFYLVLARRHGAVLLAGDDGLRQSAHNLGIETAG